MLDNFECFGDKLSDESVFSAFLSVVGKLRRGAKPEGKVGRFLRSGLVGAAGPSEALPPQRCRPHPRRDCTPVPRVTRDQIFLSPIPVSFSLS